MKTILVHGFNKNYKDMGTMALYLEKLGYECLLPNLPLRFQEFDNTVTILEEYLQEHLEEQEQFHLIGHSTGGLVIRKLISNGKFNDQIVRSVLIASPNKGSQLADLASRIKFYVNTFKTLKSLATEYINQLEIEHDPSIEIGAVAGKKKKSIFGKIIDGDNDGRVEVESVYLPDLKDYIVLPFGHKEIHYKKTTVNYVDHFLRNGTFK